jgi:ribosomal protein S18 acetylase RimI-like enzyme
LPERAEGTPEKRESLLEKTFEDRKKSMTDLTTRIYIRKNFRDAVPEDLRQLLNIEERMFAPWWARQECWEILRTRGGAGVVAEVNGRAVGFVLYKVTPPPEHQASFFKKLVHRCQLWRLNAQRPSRHVRLLHISVAPEWRRQGIGHGLLKQIHRQFQKRDDVFHALVPEANLCTQLLLRQLGYKATSVLHRRSDGDGYLMERLNGC